MLGYLKVVLRRVVTSKLLKLLTGLEVVQKHRDFRAEGLQPSTNWLLDGNCFPGKLRSTCVDTVFTIQWITAKRVLLFIAPICSPLLQMSILRVTTERFSSSSRGSSARKISMSRGICLRRTRQVVGKRNLHKGIATKNSFVFGLFVRGYPPAHFVLRCRENANEHGTRTIFARNWFHAERDDFHCAARHLVYCCNCIAPCSSC